MYMEQLVRNTSMTNLILPWPIQLAKLLVIKLKVFIFLPQFSRKQNKAQPEQTNIMQKLQKPPLKKPKNGKKKSYLQNLKLVL